MSNVNIPNIEHFGGPYAWLSNFYPAAVLYEGDLYATVENAFQAAKVPSDFRQAFYRCTPGKAKAMGRSANIRVNWQDVKEGVMLGLLRQKFAKGSAFGILLDATGDAKIIEDNIWNDTYWGVCKGVGKNRLGELLMHIRATNRS